MAARVGFGGGARVVSVDEIRDLLRDRVAQAGSQRAYARATGLHEATVSCVLSGARPTRAVLTALGVRPVLVIEGDAR